MPKPRCFDARYIGPIIMLLIDEERNALLWLLYAVGAVVTFLYLIMHVEDVVHWWQWTIVAFLSLMVAQAWPLYWMVLHWL